MAAVARTVLFRGQKLARQATSVTEDAYTLSAADLSLMATGPIFFVMLAPTTVGILYHTTAGQAAADGQAVGVGQTLTVPVTNRTPFYIVAASATGNLDMTIL